MVLFYDRDYVIIESGTSHIIYFGNINRAVKLNYLNLYYFKCILERLPGSEYGDDFIDDNKLDKARFVKFVSFFCDKKVLFRSSEELEENNFLSSYQKIVNERTFTKALDFAVKGEENAPYPKAAIIMNSCTASSAEIFIRLCKFYFGAVLIGTETYGKNVICKNIQINGFSFNMPQYRYRIAGVEAEDGGIAPDICLQDTEKSNWEDIMSQCDVVWKECLYAKI